MVDTSLLALKTIHRQTQLGRIYAQADVPRMAIHHYKNVVSLYDSASNETKKAAQTAYEESLGKLIELEGALPVKEPGQTQPQTNVILLWLYKYKNISNLRGFGKIR